MIWLIWIAGTLVSVIVVVLVIGWLLPQNHRASVSAIFPQPSDVIFDTINNWQAFPTWRSGLKSVAERKGEGGRVSWIETGSQGTIPFEVLVMQTEPTKKLVTKIADPNLPFGGTWTWELVPESNGCRVTITEDGQIYNPVFRFVSRFVLGYESTMRGVLRDLGKHLG